jgi:hypothetical protein
MSRIINFNWLNCETLSATAGNNAENAVTRVTAASSNINRGELVGFRANQTSGTVGVTTLRIYANSTRTEILAEFTMTTTAVGANTGANVSDALAIPKPFFDGCWFTLAHASAADAVWTLTPEIRAVAGPQ